MKQIPIAQIDYQPMELSNVGPINVFKGVTTLDPFNAEPGVATSMKNLTAAGGIIPALASRLRFDRLGAAIGKVIGIGLHRNTQLHAIAEGKWQRWSGTAWQELATGLNASAPWSFANFQGNLPQINLIGVNGVDAPKRYDGNIVQALTGMPTGVNFKFIDTHDFRMYAADNKAIYFSAINKPQDWISVGDSGGGSIQVETNTGEDLTAIKAGFKHLMVFKRNMFGELWGTRPTNFDLQRISETGAVGSNAVTVLDQTGYWIHDSGAFNYNGGLPRKDFSLPVIDYFNKMNKAAASGACAVSTQDAVMFSIPTEKSLVNDMTLEYLPSSGIWTVWRDFSPQTWAYWLNKLTYGDATGVYTQGADATGVAWEWVSVPFGSGPFANRHQWYKLWYVIDIPPGSEMSVYLSTNAEGDEWKLVSTDNGHPLTSRRVIIPIAQVANSNWLRVKLAGKGPVKFHELNIQQRELPLR